MSLLRVLKAAGVAERFLDETRDYVAKAERLGPDFVIRLCALTAAAVVNKHSQSAQTVGMQLLLRVGRLKEAKMSPQRFRPFFPSQVLGVTRDREKRREVLDRWERAEATNELLVGPLELRPYSTTLFAIPSRDDQKMLGLPLSEPVGVRNLIHPLVIQLLMQHRLTSSEVNGFTLSGELQDWSELILHPAQGDLILLANVRKEVRGMLFAMQREAATRALPWFDPDFSATAFNWTPFPARESVNPDKV